MQVIRLEYEVTAADVRRTTLALLLSGFAWAGAIFVLLWAGSLFAIAHSLRAGQAVPGASITIGLMGLLIPALAVLAGDRSFRRMPEWQRKVNVEFSRDGLKIADARQHVALDWDSIDSWTVRLDSLILSHKAGSKQVFVLRGLGTAERKELELLLQQCVRSSTPRSSSARAVLYLWLFLILVFVVVYNLTRQ